MTLNKWDTFSCPPGVYRGFRNVGGSDAVQLTVITGLAENSDDVSMPDSVAEEVGRDYGEKLHAWVLRHYEPVHRVGHVPLKHVRRFGIELRKRSAAPGARAG